MAKKPKPTKPTYYCPDCGCDDILFEARATWDQMKQRWDYFMDGDTDSWCRECFSGGTEWGDPADWVEPEEDVEDEEEDCDA